MSLGSEASLWTLCMSKSESEAVPFSYALRHWLMVSVIRLWMMSSRYQAKDLEKEVETCNGI